MNHNLPQIVPHPKSIEPLSVGNAAVPKAQRSQGRKEAGLPQKFNFTPSKYAIGN